jgi:hypothetical protein
MAELSRRALLKWLWAWPAVCRAGSTAPSGPLVARGSWQNFTEGNDLTHTTYIYTIVEDKTTYKFYKQITTLSYPPPMTIIQGRDTVPPGTKFVGEPLPNGGINYQPVPPNPWYEGPITVFPPPQTSTVLLPLNPSDITIYMSPYQFGPIFPGMGVAKPRAATSNSVGVIYALDTFGAITSFDADTFAQLGEITVPGGGSFLAASPDGASVYASSPQTNVLVSVDTASFQIRSTLALPAGSQPGRVMVSPDSSLVYVVFWPASTQGGTIASPSGIYVVNVAQNAIVATISSPSPNLYFFDADITPDGQLIYALAATNGYSQSGKVYVIDTGSGSVVAALDLPVNSSIPAVNKFAAMHPTGRAFYVALYTVGQTNQIAVIDTGTNNVSKIVLTAPDGSFLDTLRLQVNASGTLLIAQAYKLVTDSQGNQIEHSFLFLVDTVLNAVVGVLDLGQEMGEGTVCFGVL